MSEQWQVLARVPDRCGQARVIGVAKATFGQPFAVPAANGEMEVATFSLSSPLWARAEGVLLKPPQLQRDGVGRNGRASRPLTVSFLGLRATLTCWRSRPPSAIRASSHRRQWSSSKSRVAVGRSARASVRVTFFAVPMSRQASAP